MAARKAIRPLICAHMRAIQIEEFGGPEVMQVADLAVPEPGEDEVLIKVARAGINFADTHQRENSYLARFELPLVPGGEVAGTIERGTPELREGQRVVAMTGTGAYAEYATARAETTFPLPDDVSDEQALALLIQGLTAWHLFRTSAKLQHGESVVVHSAAGGVGSLAVQLAKPFGAGRVIATASSEEKRGLAMRLGADAALDASVDDLTEALREANGGRKVDVVLEMAGGRVFDQSLKALAPFGRLVTYGIASREPNQLSSGSLMRRSQGVIGFWLMHCIGQPGMLHEPLADLFKRAARGEIEAIVGGTYPLSDVRRAHEDIAARRTSGKLVLDPAG
jgi:NADPH2:quinone reductase